jgi:hypothetical protein
MKRCSPGLLAGKPLPDGSPGPSLYRAVIAKTVDAQTGINERLRERGPFRSRGPSLGYRRRGGWRSPLRRHNILHNFLYENPKLCYNSSYLPDLARRLIRIPGQEWGWRHASETFRTRPERMREIFIWIPRNPLKSPDSDE